MLRAARQMSAELLVQVVASDAVLPMTPATDASQAPKFAPERITDAFPRAGRFPHPSSEEAFERF